jgi:hypothetical protein
MNFWKIFLTGKTGRNKPKTFFTLPFKVGVIDRNPDVSDDNAVKLILKNEFGENFYYAYYTEDEKIFYAGFPATSVLLGKALPVFYPALVKKGCFYYKWGKNYFLFFRGEEEFYSKVSTTVPKDCENVTAVSLDKIPPTLYLRWSMKKKVFSVFVISFTLFLASFLYYLVKPGYKKVITPPVSVKVVFLKKPYCGVGEYLEKIAVKASIYSGGIKDAEYRKGKLFLVLSFPDKERAKIFAAEFGGNLKDNEVFLEEKVACGFGSGDGGEK